MYQTINKISKIISLSPILWLIGVFIFYVRARAYLGYWPNAYIPDPKSLPLEFQHWILMICVFPLIMTALLLSVIWLCRLWNRRRIGINEIMIYFIGWSAIAAVMAYPGVDFVTWFL